jgi:hypothetical protein
MNLLTTPVLYGLGAVAIAAGLFAGVQTLRLSDAMSDVAQEQAAHADTKRKQAEVLAHLAELTAQTAVAVSNREREIRGMLDSSNTAREEGIARAVEEQQRVVAGVRDESLRLRQQWRGCAAAPAVPGHAAAQPIADEGAELRATGAGDLVRVGDDADNDLAGLQQYARACQALTQPVTP